MKKWTYLVAILAMVFATPVFTGCIDNEEPAGIEELRTAKAELLRAKAAVEAAKVAQEEAKALQEQAKAKQEEALAAYRAAEAALKQAEADSVAAKAEAAAALAAAQLETALMQEKAALAAAQAAYEAALKNLELAKVALTEEQIKFLAPYVAIYKAAVAEVERLLGDVDTKAESLADAITAQDENEAKKSYLRDKKKDLAEAQAAYDAAVKAEALAKAAAEATPDAAALDAKLKELNDSLKTLDKAGADYSVEWAQLVAETEEEWNTIKDSIEYYQKLTGYKWSEDNASVARTRGITVENDDYGFVLDDEGNRVNDDGITVTPFEFDNTIIVLDGKGLPYGKGMKLVPTDNQGNDAETWSFNYPDYAKAVAEGKTYTPDEKKYWQKTARDMKRLGRNANDEAWNTEIQKTLVAMIAALQDEEGSLAENKKQLETYSEILVKGEIFADPSGMEGFENVADTVALLNEAVKVAKEAYDAFFAIDLKSQTLKEEATAKQNELEAEYKKVINEAEAIREELELTETTKVEGYEKEKDVLEATIESLLADSLVLELTDGDLTQINKDLKAAREALAELEEVIDAYETDIPNNTTTAHADSLEYYLAKHDTLWDAKIDAAQKKAMKEWAEYVLAVYQANPDEVLDADYEKLNDAFQQAGDSVETLVQSLETARGAFLEKNGLEPSQFTFAYSNYITDRLNNANEENGWEPKELVAADVVLMERSAFINEIESLSETVYGINGENEYGENTARLLALTTDELIQIATDTVINRIEEAAEVAAGIETDANIALNKKIAMANLTVKVKDELNNNFGLMGQLAALQVELEIAKAYTDNASIIEDILAQIQTAIDTVDAQIKEAVAEVDAAEASFTKLYAAYAAKFEDLDAKFEAIKAAKDVLEPVIDAIGNAIGVYLGHEDQPFVLKFEKAADAQTFQTEYNVEWGEHTTLLDNFVSISEIASVDELKYVLETIYKLAQEATYAAETKLIEAEENLQDAINEDLDLIADAEKELQKAKDNLAEAQAELEAVQKALEAVLARIGEGDMSADDAAMQPDNAAPAPIP